MKNYSEKVETIAKLLEERAAVFPVRDSSYERLSSELQFFAEELLAEVDFEKYKYDEELIGAAMSLSGSPVFICGSMKSGTTLLCHLFDSHPDLLVMPGDSHFHNDLDKWDRTQFREIATYWVHRLANPSGQEPFWFFGQEEKTFKTFLAYLNYFLRNTDKSVFVCVVMSFYAVHAMLAGPSPKKHWVEKTPHNEEHARHLSRLFPEAKFIHVLRDPLNNIVSLRKLDSYRGWRGSALDHARVIRGLFRIARSNLEALGREKYLIVKYEDLTRDPSTVMQKICGFLNIPFDSLLLIPTENGKPASSNSMFQSDRVKGEILDRGKSDRYRRELAPGELRDVVTTLYVDALKAGYNWETEEISQYKKRGFSYLLHRIVETFDSILFKIRSAAGKQ